MKLIAYLIITASVVAGSLASATAYLAPLDTPLEDLQGLELTSPAGAFDPNDPDEASEAFKQRLSEIHKQLDEAKQAQAENPLKPDEPVRERPTIPEVETEPTGEKMLAEAESSRPIGRKGDTLTPELIEILRERQVKFVKINRFDFFRWPHWWLFAVSCFGLVGGALLVRKAQKDELARANAAAEGASEHPADARTVFARLSGRLDELTKDLDRATNDDEKLDAIVRRIGNIQRDDVPAFVADRPALVSRLTLAGYAELMDHFAAMERQLNRAWSAAADGHLEEAMTSLHNAQPMVVETLKKLKR